MWPNPQFPVDYVTFTEEILNGKLQFFYSVFFFRRDYTTWSSSLSINCVKSVFIRSYPGRHSVRMQENADQNNSEYGLFSRSD